MRTFEDCYKKMLSVVEKAEKGQKIVFAVRYPTIIDVVGVGRIDTYTQGAEIAKKVREAIREKDLDVVFHLESGFGRNRTLDTLGYAKVVTEKQPNEIEI